MYFVQCHVQYMYVNMVHTCTCTLTANTIKLVGVYVQCHVYIHVHTHVCIHDLLHLYMYFPSAGQDNLDHACMHNVQCTCSTDIPAICPRSVASKSSSTVPLLMQLRSSNRLCSERLATCGLLHLLPPSSTSSSNLTHRAVSFHSTL